MRVTSQGPTAAGQTSDVALGRGQSRLLDAAAGPRTRSVSLHDGTLGEQAASAPVQRAVN